MYLWEVTKAGPPPSSSSILPPSRIQSERKGEELFPLPPSRGYLSLRFTQAEATIRGLFWNVLGDCLSPRSLEWGCSERHGAAASSGSLTEMLIPASHRSQVKQRCWKGAQASQVGHVLICSRALVWAVTSYISSKLPGQANAPVPGTTIWVQI